YLATESQRDRPWERRHPVHHEDTKTRRIAKDFFASSCLRGEIFLVTALLLRVHLWSLVQREGGLQNEAQPGLGREHDVFLALHLNGVDLEPQLCGGFQAPRLLHPGDRERRP